MVQKRSILKVIFAIVMCSILALGVNNIVKAEEEIPCVDGSYLTEEESSEVTVGSLTRGIYLKSGSSMISKAGTGKITAGGNTVGQKIVSKISVTVRVEKLVNGKWQAYSSWSATKYNSAYVSSSKTLSVPTGYYYRVYSTHTASSDSSGSYTNGIYI